ncbi:glutamine synthetase family protein [Patescibacteria group bacterium]
MDTLTKQETKIHTIKDTRLKLSKLAHDDPNALKQQILDIVKEEQVEYVKCQFTDLTGVIKSLTMPVSKLEDAIDNNVWFDGSSIDGFTRIFESDMFLKLDLSTFGVMPWSRERGRITARFICDVYTPDGNPFEGDPRYILKRQLERAKKLGLTFNTGPELEFFLFKKENGEIKTLPHDKASYFDFSTDLAVDIRKEITDALIDFDIDVETLHHEVAEGQHEISFTYSDALTTADNAATFKFTVKAIAQKYGLHATFMPKPIMGQNGSGMHVHQSLFKNGENAFYDEKSPIKLSNLALHYIAGQLKHIKAMAAITNPIVNSYKRLVPGYEAPTYIAWGNTNRSALIRIPRYTPGREKATRIELRNPDPSCNPYLAFAVMLAAGLDGIENEMQAPEPVNEDIFTLNDDKAKELKIDNLPYNLWEATKELEKDDVIRAALGEHAFESIYAARKADWFNYKTYVTKWEYDKYLSMY